MKATLIIIFFGVSNFLFGQIQDSTTLYFQIIPGQCEIKIDGIKVPHTSKTMLAQGEHRIVVWKSGFHLFDTTLTVSGQNQIILKKRLAIRDDYRVF